MAPFRTAPTARVERRHDLANMLSTVCLSWRSIRRGDGGSIGGWDGDLRLESCFCEFDSGFLADLVRDMIGWVAARDLIFGARRGENDFEDESFD